MALQKNSNELTEYTLLRLLKFSNAKSQEQFLFHANILHSGYSQNLTWAVIQKIKHRGMIETIFLFVLSGFFEILYCDSVAIGIFTFRRTPNSYIQVFRIYITSLDPFLILSHSSIGTLTMSIEGK